MAVLLSINQNGQISKTEGKTEGLTGGFTSNMVKVIYMVYFDTEWRIKLRK